MDRCNPPWAGPAHIFVSQAGKNRHEDILESLELFAAEVMPEFHAHEAARRAEKQARLGEAAARALARRDPSKGVDESYVVPADRNWKGR